MSLLFRSIKEGKINCCVLLKAVASVAGNWGKNKSRQGDCIQNKVHVCLIKVEIKIEKYT